MVSFYSSIMFIGIILIVVSLVWIAFDRKKVYDTELRMDEKKAELVKIIRDAEMMVDELNKFSDYIVTQIDQKNNEITLSFKEAEEVVERIRTESSCYYEQRKVQNDSIGNYYSADVRHRTPDSISGKKSDLVIESMELNDVPAGKNTRNTSQGKIKDNVIPLNSKHKEVINLAQKGLNETEIARKLNMGKGEIQLILGVNR